MVVLSATSDVNFSELSLADPIPLIGQSGFYYSKVSMGTENVSFQLPKGITKDGFGKNKFGQFCDIKYPQKNSSSLIGFMETLLYACQNKLNAKKALWFQTELTLDEIEGMMTPLFRIYQQGKYILIRVHIPAARNGILEKCVIYDNNLIGVDAEAVTAEKPVIPLVMVDGIKFSTTSFEICLKLVQLMVLEASPSVCLIKHERETNDDTLPNDVTAAAAQATAAPATAAPATAAPATAAPATGDSSTVVVAAGATNDEIIPTKTTLDGLSALPADATPVSVADAAPVSVADAAPVSVADAAPVSVADAAPKSVADAALALPETLLEEINVDENVTFSNAGDCITLKKPNEIYYSIYKAARDKAKKLRMVAIEAYLEAKSIKTKYMLTDIDGSDSDSENEQNNSSSNSKGGEQVSDADTDTDTEEEEEE
jgi:hypothetical protein